VADVKTLHEAGAGRPWAGAPGPVALGLGGDCVVGIAVVRAEPPWPLR